MVETAGLKYSCELSPESQFEAEISHAAPWRNVFVKYLQEAPRSGQRVLDGSMLSALPHHYEGFHPEPCAFKPEQRPDEGSVVFTRLFPRD